MPSKTSPEPVRTRMAPSPTGLFHIGAAHTALFNYLFTKQHGGKFVLRIEDTDAERSKPEFEADILDGMKWLGLEWDEGPDGKGEYGPYRQSERGGVYKKYLHILLKQGSAYPCFCSEDELEAVRSDQMTRGEVPHYNGTCLTISPEKVERRTKEGAPFVYRFRMPHRVVEFKDLIRGPITFDTALIGDIPIMKSSGVPLYNFAVVIDDHEMRISHVIRGEDHISNTPKQLMLIEALGFKIPQYAHLPLILGPDRSKLSKRHGAQSVTDFRTQGILPEAMVNFVALLGFSPKDNREILTIEEFTKEFDLKRVQKAGAVFNAQKLEWLNNHYIREKDPATLTKLILPYFKEAGLIKEENTEKLEKIVILERERIKKLSEFPQEASFFFSLEDYDPHRLVWKSDTLETTLERLKGLKNALGSLSSGSFTQNIVKDTLDTLAGSLGKGPVYWPFRVALSGREHSPPPQEIAEILGKEETLVRLEHAISALEHRP